MSAIGAFFFIVLTLARLRYPNVLGILLAVQSALTAFRLIFRSKAGVESSPGVQILAWLSALLPLALQTTASGWWSLASVPGLLLNLWALISLGSLFSISPADRGLAFSGPYRRLRHPMYAGELAALLPVILLDLSARNVAIGTTFLLSILWRIRQEEMLLENYWLYSQFVKWKMLPGVW
jgi:protein-S-isoprenylcysteine O-methyltransferase Ste14